MAGDLDRVRGAALDRVERGERYMRAAALAFAAVEGGFFLGFILLADFSNRLHLLLLLATVAVYTLVVIGLAALGAHVNRCTERVLRAIETFQQDGRGRAQEAGR
jgi:hypothetical protein